MQDAFLESRFRGKHLAAYSKMMMKEYIQPITSILLTDLYLCTDPPSVRAGYTGGDMGTPVSDPSASPSRRLYM